MGHRESRARDAQLFGDGGNGRVRVAAGSHQPEERLDIGVGCVVVIRDLGNGRDDHGVGRLAQTAVVEVGDDADDRFHPILSPLHDVLPDGVFVGPEFPGEGLIDEIYSGRFGCCRFQ